MAQPSEIAKHVHGTRDRVTVALTRKYRVAQYESYDIHVGLSSDVSSGEDMDEAYERVEADVQGEFDKLCGQFEGKEQPKGGKK